MVPTVQQIYSVYMCDQWLSRQNIPSFNIINGPVSEQRFFIFPMNMYNKKESLQITLFVIII